MAHTLARACVEAQDQPDNYQTDPTQWGTDPTYLTARIARDRPDLLERLKAGEFRSVRAAALAPRAREKHLLSLAKCLQL
jgi:hypothetical protein